MFLQNLRTRTAFQHSLLEKNTASKNLLGAQVSTADYATYLSLLYGFVKGFETNVFPMLQHSILDIEQRRKTHLLVADLNMLGINETTIMVIPDYFFAEVYQSKAAALGGMYVLEGSILGGAVICKHLKTTWGVEAIAGKVEYFTAYGSETASRWKNFLYAFCLSSVGLEEDIITSASKTFNTLHHWFTNNSINLIQHES